MSKKVLLGMSGGVDSSVSAILSNSSIAFYIGGRYHINCNSTNRGLYFFYTLLTTTLQLYTMTLNAMTKTVECA